MKHLYNKTTSNEMHDKGANVYSQIAQQLSIKKPQLSVGERNTI
jgi:hypothetical protein